MNRRSFIRLGSIAAMATTLTWESCRSRGSRAQVMRTPLMLSHICEAETILALGSEFKRKFPEAASEQKIQAQLLTGLRGELLPEKASPAQVEQLLLQKIDRDFKTGDLIVLKGWVLAKTEALQCALLFIQTS